MVKCPLCGNDNTAENTFCGRCGCRLGSSTRLIANNTLLEGRYQVEKLAGRGGMGAVYKALDRRLKNRVVAIKEMSTHAVGPDNVDAAIEAFEREAGLLICLDNPALPRVWDYFQGPDNRLYLVMDFIEGETLEAVLKRRGPIPEAEVLNWAQQLGDVLYYLHSHKPPIIFRDLKPANIMLTPEGRIKLIDFGIARHFKPGKTTDTVTYGSIGFSAPEQYGEGQTDARSDIYSLGATLYYLLTAQDPSKTPFHFEPISSITEVSPQLEKAIHKTLQLKPDDRPSNVLEVMYLLNVKDQSHTDDSPTVILNPDRGLTMKLPPSGAGSNPTQALPYREKPNYKWTIGALAIVLILFAAGFGLAQSALFTPQGVKQDSQAVVDNQPGTQSVNESAPLPDSSTEEQANLEQEESGDNNEKVDKDEKDGKAKKNITYEKYTNERFGFAIDYPREFKMEETSAKGDGMVFTSSDGQAKLKAFGSNVREGDSLQNIYQASQKYAQTKIAYQKVGSSWFVLSWIKDDSVYYLKTFVGQGSTNTFIISYPRDEKEYYDPMTIHIEPSFKPGTLQQAH